MIPIAVVGPTATGKSELGLALARAFGGEVINADAMQLYRGMDVGTAKVPPAGRQGIPHHLLDVLDVAETASVAVYQREVRIVMDRLIDAGRTPVLVGGSGLYVQAALDDLEFPGTDSAVRARLEGELARGGPAALHHRLAEVDPVAAAQILPGNGRRIVRALEVFEITGRPFSASMPRRGEPRRGTVQIGLDTDPATLDARVDRRVGEMFGAGLVGEVRRLAAQGLRDGRTAAKALGYQQVLAAIDGGVDPETTEPEIARATRRFVRRQRSWFRRDKRIHWLDSTRPDLIDAAQELVRARAAPAGGA